MPGTPSGAELHSTTTTPSRRALLAGALGGIGAWAISDVGRPRPLRATDGDIVHAGEELTSSSVTKLTNSSTNDEVLWGNSTVGGIGVHGASSWGFGVYGESDSSWGVYGYSNTSVGVRGASTSNIGVRAYSAASDEPAFLGVSGGHGTAVQGYSGTGLGPAAKPKTGVFGYANQDYTSRAVWGESPKGRAIHGSTNSGYAGYFSGKVFTDAFVELKEISGPSAPIADRARLFVRDNGSGKTQLCVRFNTGAVQVIATQP